VAVEELIRAEFPDIVEYEIVVKKQGIMDEITLKVEPRPEIEAQGIRGITARLVERLKVRTNLRFVLEPASPGELPRYALKSKRFKDLR